MIGIIDENNYDLAQNLIASGYVISQEEFDYSLDKESDITELFLTSSTRLDPDCLRKNLELGHDKRALHLYLCSDRMSRDIIDVGAANGCWEFVKETLDDGINWGTPP